MKHISIPRRIFLIFNGIVIAILALSCLIPIINVLATSFSSSTYISAGEVGLLPKGFTLGAYEYVLKDTRFWQSLWVTVKRILIGIPLNILLTILLAYPLSKSEKEFKARKIYVVFFMITMIFNGGLVPTYLLVHNLQMLDTIWALVLPSAVNVGNAIILMNFFRNLPKEIEEAGRIDGAGQFTILWRIILPLSKPSIATVTLFSIVNSWNSWYDGLIYNNYVENYPLQTYLQTTVTSAVEASSKLTDIQDLLLRQTLNASNLNAAMIFISIVPLMCVYPFVQKHFAKGLVMGSVKG